MCIRLRKSDSDEHYAEASNEYEPTALVEVQLPETEQTKRAFFRYCMLFSRRTRTRQETVLQFPAL